MKYKMIWNIKCHKISNVMKCWCWIYDSKQKHQAIHIRAYHRPPYGHFYYYWPNPWMLTWAYLSFLCLPMNWELANGQIRAELNYLCPDLTLYAWPSVDNSLNFNMEISGVIYTDISQGEIHGDNVHLQVVSTWNIKLLPHESSH